MFRNGVWIIGTLLIFVVLFAMAYVRVAPLDPLRWHVPIEASADEDLTGGAVRVIAGDDATFRALDAEAQNLKRTRVLAGSLAEGRITYVTRSFFFGFPDLTTIEQAGEEIRLYGRLRFGASDLGVNRNRLERLIAAAQ
ncbi:MAG: DUF1499 domain-containing protein [Pseudomonadota bacterium]